MVMGEGDRPLRRRPGLTGGIGGLRQAFAAFGLACRERGIVVAAGSGAKLSAGGLVLSIVADLTPFGDCPGPGYRVEVGMCWLRQRNRKP